MYWLDSGVKNQKGRVFGPALLTENNVKNLFGHPRQRCGHHA